MNKKEIRDKMDTVKASLKHNISMMRKYEKLVKADAEKLGELKYQLNNC